MTPGFVKVVPASWDFDVPMTQLVKISRDGLRGNDLNLFIKRAGYQFADRVRKLDLAPGDVPCHSIIVGATEFYGPNRNFDGFKEACCRDYHDTFVKHAKCYRNHQNSNPAKSYGYIKFSAFNDRMKRIELLSIYNGTKEAADRNGGLVADEEMSRLEGGDGFPISMACKLAFDVCSHCGNKARSRAEYCTGTNEGGHCKAGGLKHNIGKVTGDDENPILHADNPHPTFFDNSMVPRGADRTAFTVGLVKAADAKIGGAELAESMGLSVPWYLDLDEEVAELCKLAGRMAETEKTVTDDRGARLAFDASVQPAVTWSDPTIKFGEALSALADEGVILSFENFLAACGCDDAKRDKVASHVREHLPGIYGQLMLSGELPSLLANNPMPFSESRPASSARVWAQKRAADFSLRETNVESRRMLAAIRCEGKLPPLRKESMVKSAGAMDDRVVDLAKKYAIYKLAALHRAGATSDLVRAAVLQNYAAT